MGFRRCFAVIAVAAIAAGSMAEEIEVKKGMYMNSASVWLFDDGKTISYGYLSRDFTDEYGITMPKGTDVGFYQNRNRQYCTTKYDFPIPKTPYTAKAMTRLNFYEDGFLKNFVLAEDWTSPQGFIAAAGGEMTLFPRSREPEIFTVKEDFTLPSGTVVMAGSVIAFYQGGRIRNFVIGKGFVHSSGFNFVPGMRVFCDQEGEVSGVSYRPKKNYQDPQAGFIIKGGTEASWGEDFRIEMATFAFSWKDPQTGITYPSGSTQYISDEPFKRRSP